MKITDIKVHVIEIAGSRAGVHQIVQVEGLRRTQYTHQLVQTDKPATEMIMRVQTDCTRPADRPLLILRHSSGDSL